MVAGFRLASVSMRADGTLLVAGTAAPAPEEGRAGFLLVGRKSGQECRYAAAVATDPAGTTEVSCTVPLAELPFSADDVADLYYVAGQDRVRLAWQQPVRWLPYPTKFDNLSFKRKGA